MKKILKTFKFLKELDEMVGNLYRQEPGLQNTKFGYAYKRFTDKNYLPHLKQVKEQVDMIRIDNAMEDEKTKEVLMDPNPRSRGFKYSKEGLKKVIQDENKLYEEWDKKEIEIEPFISAHKPKVLTEEQKEALKGLLI